MSPKIVRKKKVERYLISDDFLDKNCFGSFSSHDSPFY